MSAAVTGRERSVPMQKKSIFQKFLAGLFALMVLASFVFIGYRIATKGDYTAREKEQCRLLSMSAARCAADASEDNPKIWDQFAEETFTIIIDHRIMPGNWVIKITAHKKSDSTEITSEGLSGWNSRSPQHDVSQAAIPASGEDAAYADPRQEDPAHRIDYSLFKKKVRTVQFSLPDESKVIPVTISADVMENENGMLIVRFSSSKLD